MSDIILLTGGGTAGHVTPNLALIPKLLAQGLEVHYAGTATGLEQKLLAENFPNVPFHIIKAGKLRRYFDPKNLLDPFRAIAGVAQSYSLCKKLKPRAVFSKGGFVSLPVVVGARLAGIPTVLHESDMTPGLANRLALPYARVVCTTFPSTAERIGKKAVFTGTPLRPALFEGSREKGLKYAGFTGKKPIMLTIGGSQGATAVNACLRETLPRLLQRFDIMHLCGKGNSSLEHVDMPGYRQIEFASQELPDLFAAADVVLSRAGSNTLCELIALCKPHLLVPLPKTQSRGDQLDNAAATSALGYSKTLLQEDMTPDTLFDELATLYNNRQKYVDAMQKADFAGGTDRVLEVILKCKKP